MECKYCKKELEGNQRKYCCDNHKRYFLRQQSFDTIKELKEKFPFLWDKNNEWSEQETEYINWCLENREKVENLIFNK